MFPCSVVTKLVGPRTIKKIRFPLQFRLSRLLGTMASQEGTCMSEEKRFIFRQLFDRESCTYTYLIGDPESRQAILIDPVFELADRDAKLVKELDLELKYVMNTHVHADHVTGTGLLKKMVRTGVESVISKAAGAIADKVLDPGQAVEFGSLKLEVRPTPGHTGGCISYVFHQGRRVFTGDTLLIRGCGRTDFQEGSSETLYESVHSQLFTLPDDYLVFPAHDYKGFTCSSIREEKEYNPRLTKSLPEFQQIMSNLNLAYPKMIDKALPANKVCGLYNLPEEMQEKVSAVSN